MCTVSLRDLALVILIGSCTVPPPFYGLEAPRTLPSGRVSITGGGGAACADRCSGAVGVAGRFRLGLGGRQEIGFDGQALRGIAGGLKLAYKIAPTDRLAFTVGVGAMYHGDTGKHASVGSDIGVTTSLGHVRGDILVFAGGRVAVAVPVWSRDIYQRGGIVEMIALAIGASCPLARRWQLLGEVAVMAGFATNRDSIDGRITTDASSGFYGALAVAWSP